MKEKSKATTKPWFNRLLQHPARKRSESILEHKTHTHIFTYLLIFPGPTRGNAKGRHTTKAGGGANPNVQFPHLQF